MPGGSAAELLSKTLIGILLALIVLLLTLASRITNLVLVSFVVVVATLEYFKMMKIGLSRITQGTFVLICLFLLVATYLSQGALPLVLLSGGLLLATVNFIASSSLYDQDGYFAAEKFALSMLISVYILIPFLLYTSVLFKEDFRFFVVAFFCSSTVVDAGANFTGILFGRIPLAPKISPKKTVEGLIGGIIAASVTILLYVVLFKKEMSGSIVSIVLTVALAGLIGHIGDLFSSLLKRKVGMKDSSRLIPTQGGILDKLDSFLFAAPATFFILYITGLT